MSKKTIIKICIDIAMTAALPILMCYSIVGETAHEVIGSAMFCLFIAHHILNLGYIKTLFKGKYPPKRIVSTTVNILAFVCMIGLMYSGIVISKHVFFFIELGGTMTARNIHMLCAYWGLVLMSIHLGMHITQMAAMMRIKNKTIIYCARGVFALIAAAGVYEFYKHSFFDHMFGRVQFAFIDVTASAVLTTLEYFSVMILFAYVGYLLGVFLPSSKIKIADPEE